jgi:hypothetical protein
MDEQVRTDELRKGLSIGGIALAVMVVVAVLAVLLLRLAAWEKVNQVKITVGASTQFSRAEIDSAIDCIKEYVAADSDIAKLDSLDFDQKMSTLCAKTDIDGSLPIFKQVGLKNIIVIYGSFKTGWVTDGGFASGDEHTSWSWELVRDNAGAPWRVVSAGMG